MPPHTSSSRGCTVGIGVTTAGLRTARKRMRKEVALAGAVDRSAHAPIRAAPSQKYTHSGGHVPVNNATASAAPDAEFGKDIGGSAGAVAHLRERHWGLRSTSSRGSPELFGRVVEHGRNGPDAGGHHTLAPPESGARRAVYPEID